MVLRLLLEDFDAPPAAPLPEVETGPSEDWLDGHAAGVAEGLARAAATSEALSAQVAQSLADLSFTYAEARAQVLAALQPLFATLAGQLLPGLAQESLRAHLAEMLEQAAAADSTSPMELALNPGQAKSVAASLPPQPGLPFRLTSEPGVQRDTALLRQAGRATLLDAAALIADLRQSLGPLIEPLPRKVQHD